MYKLRVNDDNTINSNVHLSSTPGTIHTIHLHLLAFSSLFFNVDTNNKLIILVGVEASGGMVKAQADGGIWGLFGGSPRARRASPFVPAKDCASTNWAKFFGGTTLANACEGREAFATTWE